MEPIILPWGKDETVELDKPAAWRLKGVKEPVAPSASLDVASELDKGLARPIGMPPLQELAQKAASAAIVIDDRTRPTPVHLIAPRVVEELESAGISRDSMVVVIALGTHRDMTEPEICERVGEDVARTVRVINHRYDDPANLVSAGRSRRFRLSCSFHREVMNADLVVSIGCIEAHEQAGVGGGYKNIMPGVSDPAPIYKTHAFNFQKPPRISSSGMPKSECRFRQAVDDCGELLGPKLFIVNTVFVRGQVAALVAGDPVRAHDAGREVYERMAGIELPEAADIVISDARPLDIDLRVTLKSCFNSSAALKKGGLFICVSRTEEGLGDLRLPGRMPSFARQVIKATPLNLLSPLANRINVSPDQAAGTVSLLRMLKSFKRLLFLTSMEEGMDAFKNMGMEFFTDRDKLMARAQELMPEGEFLVLPHGGSSFIRWD
ncbi:MAG: lactate racemase domain-containing protein [bacterium]